MPFYLNGVQYPHAYFNGKKVNGYLNSHKIFEDTNMNFPPLPIPTGAPQPVTIKLVGDQDAINQVEDINKIRSQVGGPYMDTNNIQLNMVCGKYTLKTLFGATETNNGPLYNAVTQNYNYGLLTPIAAGTISMDIREAFLKKYGLESTSGDELPEGANNIPIDVNPYNEYPVVMDRHMQ